MTIKLANGDCLEVMKQIPDGSVDLILTDPPYGTVKGADLDGWGGNKTDWDVVLENKKMFSECNRILRNNGSLLLFCQEPYTSKLINESHKNTSFSYRLTWVKDHFANALLAKKAPVNYIEDICVFFKKHTKHDFKGFHPIRQYAKLVLNYIDQNLKQINNTLGHRKAEHFFYVDSTQFNMCTEQTYNELISKYLINKMSGFRSFSDIHDVDKQYRKKLISKMIKKSPKIFNLPEGKKFKSNILKYKKDYQGLHPTQKPVKLLINLIETYTNTGDTVLDFTMGSGSTGIACIETNRSFIGIELDENYYKIAKDRILNHDKQ